MTEQRLECIYTMSSNATKKYTLNILEALSVPFGWVCHFRYRTVLIDPELLNLIPLKGEKLGKELKKIKVIDSYLYQEKKSNEWKWIAIYPFRLGVLMDAYKTGNEDTDVVHLFVKLTEHVSYKNQQAFTDIIKTKLGNKFNQYYASLSTSLEESYVASREDSKSAFYKICESIKSEHFKSPEGNEYYPVPCFIEGLKNRKGDFIDPTYDVLSYKSFYEIGECERYTFEFCLYFVEKPPEFEIGLSSDKNIFSTPAEYKLKISSRYDEESWTIISSLLERDIWSSISFKTKLQDKINNKKSLNIQVEFPVKIKRKRIYRFIDYAGDIGFAIGTASIASAKVIENKWWVQHWVWFLLGGYILFAICKGIIKFWRG